MKLKPIITMIRKTYTLVISFVLAFLSQCGTKEYVITNQEVTGVEILKGKYY